MMNPRPAPFELRFSPLTRHGRGYSFPCDAKGLVDLDALNERARNNDLFARTAIGRELAWPAVRPVALH